MSAQNLSPIGGDRYPIPACPGDSGDSPGTGHHVNTSSQVNNPFTCPAPIGDRSGTRGPGHLSPLSPSLSRGQGVGQVGRQSPKPTPLFELDRITMRRRAAKHTTCPTCGQPTWTGPDDTPHGPQTKTVTLDRGRLTRLGMYQAATTGRRIYTLRNSKVGHEIDWLGEIAQPNPDRDHLLVAHDCAAPTLDTQPAPDITATLNGIPPF